MHAKFVTLWLQVVQPLTNVHETKWTPQVKRESQSDVAQSYISSAFNDKLGPTVEACTSGALPDINTISAILLPPSHKLNIV